MLPQPIASPHTLVLERAVLDAMSEHAFEHTTVLEARLADLATHLDVLSAINAAVWTVRDAA